MSQSEQDDFTQKMGVFIEHMNDQFERVLEAVDSKTAILPEMQKKLEKLDRMSDKIEMTQADVKLQSIQISSIQHNVKMLKLRSDQEQEANHDLSKEVTSLEKRVSKLETA